jgi:hypothetical protein
VKLRILMVLFLLGAGPKQPSPEQIAAQQVQLQEKMEKLAARNAWNGVEDAWVDLEALRTEVDPKYLLIAADAARNRGDVWNAYQRMLRVLHTLPEDSTAHEQMRLFREGFGRVTVRRVELTPIELVPAAVPFDPVQRHAIDFASAQLKSTGGFDGMLPAGDYKLGPYAFTIVAGLEPVIVQRVAGDGQK